MPAQQTETPQQRPCHTGKREHRDRDRKREIAPGSGVIAEPRSQPADKSQNDYRRHDGTGCTLPPLPQRLLRGRHLPPENQRRPDVTDAQQGRNRKQQDGQHARPAAPGTQKAASKRGIDVIWK